MNSPVVRHALLVALTVALPSLAQAGFSVGVSPAVVEMQVEPGESQTRVVYFRNRGDHPLAIGTEVGDVIFDAQGQFVPLPPGGKAESLAPWVIISPAVAEVPPKSEMMFRITVSVPAHASGAHYGVVYFASEPSGDGRAVMGFGARLPARLLVTTTRTNPVVAAKLVQIRLPTRNQNLGFVLELRNTGDVHVWAEPRVELMGQFEEFVGNIVPEQARVLLYPGQVMTLPLVWGGAMSPASYEAFAVVEYDGLAAVDSARFDVKIGTADFAPAADAVAEPAPAPVADAAPPKAPEVKASKAKGRTKKGSKKAKGR